MTDEIAASPSEISSSTAVPAAHGDRRCRTQFLEPRTLDLWRVAYRALRARYKLAVLLTVPALVIGAAIGWRCGKHLYRAEGLVRIASVLPQVMQETDQNRPMPMFDGFMQAQQQLMSSPQSIEAAMEEPSWRGEPRAGGGRSPENFAASLKVEVKGRSDFLRLSFVDRDPAVAAAAIRSLIAAYQKVYDREQQQPERQRMSVLEQRRNELTEQLGKVEAQVVALAQARGAADVEASYEAAALRLRKLKTAIGDIHRNLAALTEVSIQSNARAPSQQTPTTGPSKSGEAARPMRLLGPEHPVVQRLKGEETNLRRLTELAAQDLSRLDERRSRMRDLQAQATVLRNDLTQVSRRLEVLSTEASSGSRLAVVMQGEEPIIALLDNRPKAAAVGAAAGAAVPLSLLVLLELVRRRYRYCAEVAEQFAEHYPVVAVLPEVARTAALATAAAHTLHQLRVHMQPQMGQGSRVHLIAGATSGDGTSSVALCLALSFTAAGYKTLLIDGDFATRGLSLVMGAEDCEGLCDAAPGVQPLIRPTRVGLSFMAAGRSSERAAALQLPRSIEQVVQELRARFDVILVDGSAILTSLDASVMAPLTDGVILTFARGCDQATVMKAARQIEALGSTCCGVVFNRAKESDFRAALRYWLRDEQAEERDLPERLVRFGPLVTAMLSSLKFSRADDLDLLPAKRHPALSPECADSSAPSQPQAA